jgi:4-amino-4-deoxy-L-arabinose transferase-like glycosyltransferase
MREPLAWWLSGSIALTTRLVVGVALIGMVSLLLFEMSGHRWQPDIHMYFFVAFAMLSYMYRSNRQGRRASASWLAAGYLSLVVLLSSNLLMA